jgi:hypothetical protein
VLVGVVADAQAADRLALLHARGDVDADAADGAALVDTSAQQHAAGVDAHAHVESVLAELLPIHVALRMAFRQQRQAGTHGAFRVVLDGTLGAEGGEQAVAGVLEHLAAMALHQGCAYHQQTVHDLLDVFGVEVLAQRRGADDVQHLHLLEQPLRPCGELRRASRAQRCQRGVGHRIAQHPPLRFQGLDGGLELLQLGRHADAKCDPRTATGRARRDRDQGAEPGAGPGGSA